MTKESTKFEELTAEVFSALRNDPKLESVEHNVSLIGEDGPRQIDVVVRGKVGPVDILTVVECKDQKRKVDIGVVDAFHSKSRDVKAHKSVLVSRSGYSKKALEKGKRVGMSLCTLHDAKYEKWKFHPQIPVNVEETILLDVDDTYEFIAVSTTPIVYPVICNGVQLRDLFFSEWNKGNITNLEPNAVHIWNPPIKPPYKILNQKTEYVPIHKFEVKYRTKIIRYFGYVGQLDYTKVLYFADKKEGRMLFNENTGFNYRNRFIVIPDTEEVPVIDSFSIEFAVRSDVKKIKNPNYKLKEK